MLIPLKSTSLVPVMISNTSVPICNRFHDRQANSSKIITFSMAKISYAGCVGSSPTISAQFTLDCALQLEIAKKSINPLFWEFMVIQGQRC